MTLRQESPGARPNAETLDCIFITLKREEHNVAFSALGRDNVIVIAAKRSRGAHAILKGRIERANNQVGKGTADRLARACSTEK